MKIRSAEWIRAAEQMEKVPTWYRKCVFAVSAMYGMGAFAFGLFIGHWLS